MPPIRYLTLLAVVLAAAAATVAAGAILAPALPDGAGQLAGLAALLAAGGLLIARAR